MTGLTAAFGKPFAEQVAAFRLRLGDLIPTAKWDDIQRAQHDRAFIVAGAIKADLLADLAAAIDKAVSQGTTLEAFRRDFRQIVETRGWHGWTGEGTKGGEAWRTKVIYKTNMATTYAAGRMAQLVAGNFAYWVYRHGASLEPRVQHLGWDGLILTPDHPFWATHAPPNGWGCSCFVVGARTLAGAQRVGGKPGLELPMDWAAPVPKTGAPAGIDKGWDYAPGASVARTVAQLAPKLASYPAQTGADILTNWPDRLFTSWSSAFGDFLDSMVQGRVDQKSTFILGALQPRWLQAMPAQLQPRTAEIAVSQVNVAHTFRPGKTGTIDLLWYRSLPEHLRRPAWVLLDQSKPQRPTLLLGFDVPGTTTKMVLTLDYGQKRTMGFNLLTTGRTLNADALTAMKGQLQAPGRAGWYILIDGALP